MRAPRAPPQVKENKFKPGAKQPVARVPLARAASGSAKAAKAAAGKVVGFISSMFGRRAGMGFQEAKQ